MKIKGLRIMPYKEPEEIEIENTLENLQRLVEGMIDIVQLEEDGVDIYINDEGKLLQLPLNRIIVYDNHIIDTLVGNLALFGVNEATGETVSLNEEQIKKYQKIFSHEIINLNEVLKK